MKHFIKKLSICILFALISLAAGILFFFWGFGVLAILSWFFWAGCILAVVFEVRDYRFYKELSAQMQGKTLDEKLEILNYHEECWLSYASPEEVNAFREEVAANPKNKFLDYLLERAASYGK